MKALVIPTMRPEQAGHVRRQVDAQGPDVYAVVVVNGPARPSDYPWADAVLCSPQSKPIALDLGITWARSEGATSITLMDDDDIYIPGWVAESAAAIEAGAVWCVQRSHYCLMPSGLWLMEGREYWGGSITVSPDAPGWDGLEHLAQAEENAWASRHAIPPHVLSPGLYCRVRGNPEDHVWPASERTNIHACGGAWHQCPDLDVELLARRRVPDTHPERFEPGRHEPMVDVRADRTHPTIPERYATSAITDQGNTQ